MTPAELQSVPRDLGVMQYAAWLAENCLALPANRSNMEVISQALEAISKAKFRDKPRPAFTAFLWLERQCEFAKQRAIPLNHLFFLNGEYNEIDRPEKPLPEFKGCEKCVNGWVTVESNLGKKVKRCECWESWRASVKS